MVSMDIRINLVRVSPETRETIKRQVVNLYQNGYKAKKIGEILCISEYAARRIIDTYKEKGMGVVKEATRGRKEGEKRILSAKQEKKFKA